MTTDWFVRQALRDSCLHFLRDFPRHILSDFYLPSLGDFCFPFLLYFCELCVGLGNYPANSFTVIASNYSKYVYSSQSLGDDCGESFSFLFLLLVLWAHLLLQLLHVVLPGAQLGVVVNKAKLNTVELMPGVREVLACLNNGAEDVEEGDEDKVVESSRIGHLGQVFASLQAHEGHRQHSGDP